MFMQYFSTILNYESLNVLVLRRVAIGGGGRGLPLPDLNNYSLP